MTSRVNENPILSHFHLIQSKNRDFLIPSPVLLFAFVLCWSVCSNNGKLINYISFCVTLILPEIQLPSIYVYIHGVLMMIITCYYHQILDAFDLVLTPRSCMNINWKQVWHWMLGMIGCRSFFCFFWVLLNSFSRVRPRDQK